MCNKVVSEDPFILQYCHDKYKTREVCDKTVDSCLLASKFVSDWSITSRTIKKLDSDISFNDSITFGDFDFVTFFTRDICHNSITLDNIDLEDNHFGYCDSQTINYVKLMAWYNKYKQGKAFKRG